MSNLTQSEAWQNLQSHFASIKDVPMRQMFAQDPQRFDKFSISFGSILYDYSKNRINQESMDLLLQLAKSADLSQWIKKMFAGDAINSTENRSVLHVALRDKRTEPLIIDGIDIVEDVNNERAKVFKLANAIRSRQWRGVNNQAITDVVNIGIGGSHLGPQMLKEALKPYSLHDLNVHFVSNIDENQINETLQYLNPETTLFIIASKTFTTQETMVNANFARQWYMQKIGDDSEIYRHFVAVTCNVELATQFGIREENIFKMWDWVGGRYSLWCAIGLASVIAIGPDNFNELLEGAYEVDQHFQNAPLEQNIPVIMALLGIWYNNFFGAETIAILPYDQHLHRFPAYLQQADMESNGKFVDRQGERVDYSTGPVLFGEIGNSGQHAFFQLLHQGTKIVPGDIIAPIHSYDTVDTHHKALMSNVFAQTEALMRGKTKEEARAELQAEGKLDDDALEALLPNKVFEGNRPTSTFLFDHLTPKTLGSLVALYEHKIFVQGVIWNINSYDQWGVELGKQLAKSILPELENPEQKIDAHDSSTNGLINYFKQNYHP